MPPGDGPQSYRIISRRHGRAAAFDLNQDDLKVVAALRSGDWRSVILAHGSPWARMIPRDDGYRCDIWEWSWVSSHSMMRLFHILQWFERHEWCWMACILSSLAVGAAGLFWHPVPQVAVVALFFIMALVLILIAWFWYTFLRAWWLWERDAARCARGHCPSPPMRRLLRWAFNATAAVSAVPIMTRVQQWRSVGAEAIAAVFLSRDVPFWQRFGQIIMASIFFFLGVKTIGSERHLSGLFFFLSVQNLVLYPFAIRSFIRKRSKDRLAAGFCPACGYDLCATAGRCPECGALPERTETQPAGAVQPSP